MHNFFLSVGLVILSLITGNTHHAAAYQKITPTPTVVTNEVTANGSLTKYGQTITFTFSFPQTGGKIEGDIGGACKGTIQGTYSGGTVGQLIGNSYASCTVFYTTFTGDVSFDSQIDTNKPSQNLPVNVVFNGTNQDTSIPLTLSK